MYGDKLIDVKDMDTFKKMKYDTAKAAFEVRCLSEEIMILHCRNRQLGSCGETLEF